MQAAHGVDVAAARASVDGFLNGPIKPISYRKQVLMDALGLRRAG